MSLILEPAVTLNTSHNTMNTRSLNWIANEYWVYLFTHGTWQEPAAAAVCPHLQNCNTSISKAWQTPCSLWGNKLESSEIHKHHAIKHNSSSLTRDTTRLAFNEVSVSIYIFLGFLFIYFNFLNYLHRQLICKYWFSSIAGMFKHLIMSVPGL